MTRKRTLFVLRLRASLRRRLVRLQEILGPFAEAFVVLIVGMVFLAAALFFQIGGPSDWASYVASFLVSAFTIYLIRRTTYQHTVLIEVTMAFLVEGGKPLLDQLLGKLIAGTWHAEDFRPGNVLFKAIDEVVAGQDWEMKRRIVEALPALSEIDAKRTLQATAILRDDWEPSRWQSDLRRRSVEALVIAAAHNRLPMIHRAKSEAIEPFLRLRERDQVYTAFAVLEAIWEWDETRPALASQLRDDLLAFSTQFYTNDEQEAVQQLGSLLSVLRSRNSMSAVRVVYRMLENENHLVRIAACRNAIRLFDRFPDTMLDVMWRCTEPGEHVNVRRPVARERSVDLLIKMVRKNAYREKAEAVLFRLMSDVDDMVRIPTFDKIELIAAEQEDLALRLCDHVIAHDPSPILVERAQRVKNHLLRKTDQ